MATLRVITARGVTPERLAGWGADTLLESAVFAGAAQDVTDVIVGGREVVRDRRHLAVGDVAGALHRAITGI